MKPTNLVWSKLKLDNINFGRLSFGNAVGRREGPIVCFDAVDTPPPFFSLTCAGIPLDDTHCDWSFMATRASRTLSLLTLLLTSCSESRHRLRLPLPAGATASGASSGLLCSRNTGAAASAGAATIAMLPKLINIDYFDACKRGATKAAEELNVH